MALIHPTAVVEATAELGENVRVGPLCYVGPKVKIGEGSKLVSHVCLLGRTTIGAGNTVWPHTTLGGDPQDFKFRGEDSQLIIGDHNDIRENVTIHKGTEHDRGITRIGGDNLIMAGVHVAHDCVINDHTVLANGVQLAGHVHVESHACMGGLAAAHHFVTIGQYAFVGGLSRVVADVPPFMIVEGNKAEVRGVNLILLERNQFPDTTVEALKDAYRTLYRNDDESSANSGNITGNITGNMAANLDRLLAQWPDETCIHTLVAFIRQKQVGLHGRYREALREDDKRDNPKSSHLLPRP